VFIEKYALCSLMMVRREPLNNRCIVDRAFRGGKRGDWLASALCKSCSYKGITLRFSVYSREMLHK